MSIPGTVRPTRYHQRGCSFFILLEISWTIIFDSLWTGNSADYWAKDGGINNKGPVTGMESGGVYDMPEGTWTDDSSMALATMASIIEKGVADPADIMMRFVKWELKGEYTPFGEAFDQGNTCTNAIYNFIKNPDIDACGSTGEYANGNGALMRIMPACLYYYDRQKLVCTSEDEAIHGIHKISGLTHNHLRSQMCCGIYYFCVKNIIDGVKKDSKASLLALLQEGIDKGLKYYGHDIRNLTEMAYLGRLFHLKEFKEVPEDRIKTSGYVIDSIEAAIWCLINTNSYKECMLKAVNLGDDTDTVAAIVGGLAGLYYGYEGIPSDWLAVIKKRELKLKELHEFALQYVDTFECGPYKKRIRFYTVANMSQAQIDVIVANRNYTIDPRNYYDDSEDPVVPYMDFVRQPVIAIWGEKPKSVSSLNYEFRYCIYRPDSAHCTAV